MQSFWLHNSRNTCEMVVRTTNNTHSWYKCNDHSKMKWNENSHEYIYVWSNKRVLHGVEQFLSLNKETNNKCMLSRAKNSKSSKDLHMAHAHFHSDRVIYLAEMEAKSVGLKEQKRTMRGEGKGETIFVYSKKHRKQNCNFYLLSFQFLFSWKTIFFFLSLLLTSIGCNVLQRNEMIQQLFERQIAYGMLSTMARW